LKIILGRILLQSAQEIEQWLDIDETNQQILTDSATTGSLVIQRKMLQ
jgi:hypothetical protein